MEEHTCTECQKSYRSAIGLKVHHTTIHAKPAPVSRGGLTVEQKMKALLEELLDEVDTRAIKRASFREKLTAIGILSDKLIVKSPRSIVPIQINIRANSLDSPQDVLQIRALPPTQEADGS